MKIQKTKLAKLDFMAVQVIAWIELDKGYIFIKRENGCLVAKKIALNCLL